jgi:hypothetical protein
VLDFIVTEDVRNGPLSSATESIFRWNLVLRVLGRHEASKSDHGLKSVMALRFRWSEARPVDGGCRDDMRLPARRGKSGKVA